MPFQVELANASAAILNALLKPRATRRIDINDPDWLSAVRALPHPLDEAGIRAEAEALVASLLDGYAMGDEPQRASIRELFRKNPAFAWATRAFELATTAQAFRRGLLRVSAENGGNDLRDEIVQVNEMCARARQAGVPVEPILEEVAELSSREIVHGMDSMWSILRCAAGLPREMGE